MLVPMSPTSSLFLLAETREHPMHVGGLQLFTPPDGADVLDIRERFDTAVAEAAAGGPVAPLFQKRARRSVTSLYQWGWETDRNFDIEHHVRRSALPQPGRILELLALCSRLHSTLLDRHRPLWELHLIEGLEDGRFATYFKSHHALVDGVSATRLLTRMLSEDPDDSEVPAFWVPRSRTAPSGPREEADQRAPRRPVLRGRRRRPAAGARDDGAAGAERAGRGAFVVGAAHHAQRPDHGIAPVRCAVLADQPDPAGRQGR